MELETTIHELLARRTQRRLEVFRSGSSRWKEASASHAGNPHPLRSLEDAKAVTTQRGFLREQLRMASLTPLKRWHAQLQLVEMDDRDARHTSTLNDRTASANPQSPLERSLAAIQRDRACFDISFAASPARVVDLKETLFDASDDHARRVSEALAFSSTRQGSTMRVVLVRLENSAVAAIRARSSLFVPDLQQHVDTLVKGECEDNDVRVLLDSLWS